MKLRSFVLLFIATIYSIALVADDNHHHDAGEKLGTVDFPTSCKAETQKQFERGLAWLYSFEYAEAEQQFKEVSRQDPQCGMAYWGQAMSLYHQLWARPGKADLKLGAELLEKAKALKPATARERE